MSTREQDKILITGPPGCGKTTLITRIVSAFEDVPMAGFYTGEIRRGKKRTGFTWTLLDGRSGKLAGVDIRSPYRVGKYGVDIERFEQEVVPAIDPAGGDAGLFVIDEIGKMECFCARFVETVRRLMDSDIPVVATVARKGTGLIPEVKKHPRAMLFEMTPSNRDRLGAEIIARLREVH
jgi:nucleoside-triphosphatase THEP1